MSARSQRSFAPAAPKFGAAHYEPLSEELVVYKKAKKKEWRPEPYTQMLYDHMFKKWSVDTKASPALEDQVAQVI